MKTKNINFYGFSLIEVMVAMGLLSVMSLGILKTIDISNSGQANVDAKFEGIELQRNILQNIQDASGCALTFNGLKIGDDLPGIKNVNDNFIYEINKTTGLNNLKLIKLKTVDKNVTFSDGGKYVDLVIGLEKTKGSSNKTVLRDLSFPLKVYLDASNNIKSCTIDSLSGEQVCSALSGMWSGGFCNLQYVNKSGDTMSGTLIVPMIGMGTASPTTTLDVKGNIQTSENNGHIFLTQGNSIGVAGTRGWNSRAISNSSAIKPNAYVMDFINGVTGTEVFSLYSNGKAAVGNNSSDPGFPTYNLHVFKDADEGIEIGVQNNGTTQRSRSTLIAKATNANQININAYGPNFVPTNPWEQPLGISLSTNTGTTGGFFLVSRGNGTTGFLSFFTGNPAQERLHIESNGSINGLASFRGKKGNTTPSTGDGDATQAGYSFENDGDTGMFAVGGTDINQSDLLFKIDNINRLSVLRDGPVQISNYQYGRSLVVSGSVAATGYFYTSDEKLKKNIKPIENPLDKILKLIGVSFNWKESNKASIGLIAQNVEKVFPELVDEDKTTKIKSVEYANLVGPLIEAIRELNEKNIKLEQKINALEKKLGQAK